MFKSKLISLHKPNVINLFNFLFKTKVATGQLTPPSPVEALGPSSCSSTCDLGNRNRTRRHSRRWEHRKLGDDHDDGDGDHSGDNGDQSLLSSQETFQN